MYDDFKYGSSCRYICDIDRYRKSGKFNDYLNFNRSAGKECLINSQVMFDIEEISLICGKPIPISPDSMNNENEDDMDDGNAS